MNPRLLRGVYPIVALAFAALQSGCGGGGGGGGALPLPSTAPPPTATVLGTATGAATSVALGADGGTLASPDGTLKVTVPAGALASTTTISLQPITNHAHGGTGQGYRLMPEGQVFAKPVRLTFTYGDADLAGSAAGALGIAFQRPDRFWEWMDATVDTAARTVSVETTHFSDWSLVQGFRLFPHSSTVATGKTVALKAVYCYPAQPIDGWLEPLGYACEGDDPVNGIGFLHGISDWSVDGVVGGSGTKGTITADGYDATFKAPSTVPAPDTVAVSARMVNRTAEKVLVVATVKIVESADYSGTIEFTNAVAAGTATVNWTKLQETDGIAVYKASGTIDVTTNMEGCSPTRVTLPLVSDSDASIGAYKMIVYPDGTGSTFSKAYYFHLAGDGPDVSVQCGESTLTFPAYFLTSVAIGVLGACPLPPTYADRAQLTGNWSCATTENGGTWAFNAPQ